MRWPARFSARRRPSKDLNPEVLHAYFGGAYVASNMIVAAAGNLEHDARARVDRDRLRSPLAREGEHVNGGPPRVVPQVITRTKELEQSHICLGTDSYPQRHEDRYVSYILNTVLGGSMSSRLFQNVREKARPGVCRIQRTERVSRCRQSDDLCGMRERRDRGSGGPLRRGASHAEADPASPIRSSGARRTISRAA